MEIKKIKVLLLIVIVSILGSCSNTEQKENSILNQVPSKKNSTLKKENKLKSINIVAFKRELKKGGFTLIDLRTSKELEETGVIPGANQLDFYSSDFKNKINNLDKNKKYLIYCRSGGRSSKTLGIMKQLGFTNVLELEGGMNNWLSSGEKTDIFMGNIDNSMMKSGDDNEDMMNSGDDNENNASIMMNSKKYNTLNKIVTLNAKKWEFDKKVIRVQKGQKLTLKVNNIDVLHGIAIPAMKIIGDNEIEVDTSKVGEYEFRCANYCGEGHQDMTGKIIID